MANQIVWVDIPVVDLDRSIRFYSAMLGGEVQKQDFSGMKFAVLPHQGGEVGGCLVCVDGSKPSDQGPLVYLNAQGRLDEAIASVEPLGGKILQAKHQIGSHGYRAVILDTEGNRVALHSR